MNFIKEYDKEFTYEMLKKSVVAIDTNCLLSPLNDYVMGSSIVKAFSKVSQETDVYIPFVTQIEFLENKTKVLTQRIKNVKKANGIRKKISDTSSILDNNLNNLINNKLFGDIEQEKNADDMRSMYEETIKFKEQFIEEAQKLIGEKLSKLDNELINRRNQLFEDFSWTEISSDVREIESKLTDCIEGFQLGVDYSSDKLEDYIKKIEDRYSKKISPGYEDIGKDKDKGTPKTIFLSGKTVKRSYSDAIFWLDILDCIKENIEKYDDKEYLLILSNETKSDWVINRNSQQLNVDMFSECYRETKLFAKKIDIWSFVKLFKIIDEHIIEQSQNIFESLYSFMLYGQNYEPMNQREMMEKIFGIVFPKVNGGDYIDLPCVREEADLQSNNSNFNSNFTILDKNGDHYVIGTSLNIEQKLDYIYRLLEARLLGSAQQLKFYNNEIEEKWRQVCLRKRK